MTITASINRSVFIAALLASASFSSLEAQQSSGLFYQTDTTSQTAPQTAPEKLGALSARYDKAMSEFSSLVGRLPQEPYMLGSQQLFDQIDVADREFKQVRSKLINLLTKLEVQQTKISKSSYFSDEQKKELIDASKNLVQQGEELKTKIEAGVKSLSRSYKVFQTWKRIHNTYNDLNGSAKAAEILKQHIDDYMKSFTPEPKKSEDSDESEPFSSDQQ